MTHTNDLRLRTIKALAEYDASKGKESLIHNHSFNGNLAKHMKQISRAITDLLDDKPLDAGLDSNPIFMGAAYIVKLEPKQGGLYGHSGVAPVTEAFYHGIDMVTSIARNTAQD